MDQGVSLKDYI